MPWWVPVICLFLGVLLTPFAEYLKSIWSSLNAHRHFTNECIAFKKDVFERNLEAYGSIYEAVHIAYALERFSAQIPVRVITPVKFEFFSEDNISETFFHSFSEKEQRLVRLILENISYLNERAEHMSYDLKNLTSADSLFLTNDISKLVSLYINIELYLDPEKERDSFGKLDDFCESLLNRKNYSMCKDTIKQNLISKFPDRKELFQLIN